MFVLYHKSSSWYFFLCFKELDPLDPFSLTDYQAFQQQLESSSTKKKSVSNFLCGQYGLPWKKIYIFFSPLLLFVPCSVFCMCRLWELLVCGLPAYQGLASKKSTCLPARFSLSQLAWSRCQSLHDVSRTCAEESATSASLLWLHHLENTLLLMQYEMQNHYYKEMTYRYIFNVHLSICWYTNTKVYLRDEDLMTKLTVTCLFVNQFSWNLFVTNE